MPSIVKKEKDHYGSLKKGKKPRGEMVQTFCGIWKVWKKLTYNKGTQENTVVLHKELTTWIDYSFNRILSPYILVFIFCGKSGDSILSPTNLPFICFFLIRIRIHYQSVFWNNPAVICTHCRNTWLERMYISIYLGKNLFTIFPVKVVCGIWIALCGIHPASHLPDFLSRDVPEFFIWIWIAESKLRPDVELSWLCWF